jgi:NitT/TauT family transport system ATP-binding protein
MVESGLLEFKNFRTDKLSGGMQKRLALARAFSCPSDFLLLDEAFSAVDLKQKIELMRAFLRLWSDEKPTTMVVTHDLHDALFMADDIIVLSQRPSRVIGQMHIDIPHEERAFASESISHYERELYRLLGFDNYERNHQSL